MDIILIAIIFAIIVSTVISAKASAESRLLNDTVRKKLEEIVREVKVEKHHDIIYWFDKENDKFLAQGETISEIQEVLKQRFPKHIFILEQQLYIGPTFEPVAANDWKAKMEAALK